MYKVYFEESFFEGLDEFILSMKRYYSNFYSNTGIYDEYKIRQGYFDKYKDFKGELLLKINNIGENGVLGRKITYNSNNIEHISFNFNCCNYNISFTAIKNNDKKEIIIATIKIN